MSFRPAVGEIKLQAQFIYLRESLCVAQHSKNFAKA
jgi:hypothetical protein